MFPAWMLYAMFVMVVALFVEKTATYTLQLCLMRRNKALKAEFDELHKEYDLRCEDAQIHIDKLLSEGIGDQIRSYASSISMDDDAETFAIQALQTSFAMIMQYAMTQKTLARFDNLFVRQNGKDGEREVAERQANNNDRLEAARDNLLLAGVNTKWLEAEYAE